MNPAFTTRAGWHTAALYAAMFAALGAILPFWPVWLEDWGLSTAEIGLYASTGVAARVVAGIALPVLADRLDRRRLTLLILCLLAAGIHAAHVLIEARPLLLAATIAAGALLAGIMPLGEALGTAAATRHGFPYAYPRALGSVAFLAANIVVGLMIAQFGSDSALWWAVLFLAITGLLAHGHPGGGSLGAARPPGLREIGALLVNPTFALFSIAAAFCLSSHAVYYAYGSVHWRAQGIGEGTIGALWAFSVGVEVIFMLALGPLLIRRIGAVGALMLSGAGGILRWGLMMVDPGLIWLWPLQAMHTLTFVAGHLGAIAFIATAIPDRYGASAQGAFMGLAGGVLTTLGMGASALAYPLIGGGSYAIAVAMSAIGLGLCWWLARRWHGEVLEV